MSVPWYIFRSGGTYLQKPEMFQSIIPRTKLPTVTYNTSPLKNRKRPILTWQGIRPSFSFSQRSQTSSEELCFIWTAKCTFIADYFLLVSITVKRISVQTENRGWWFFRKAQAVKGDRKRLPIYTYIIFNFTYLLVTSLPSFLDLNRFSIPWKSLRTEE